MGRKDHEDLDEVLGQEEDTSTDPSEETSSPLFTTRALLEQQIKKRTVDVLAWLSREVATSTQNIPSNEIEAGLWDEASVDEFLFELLRHKLKDPLLPRR